MTIEVNKTKAAMETAVTDLKNMGALNKVTLLTNSLKHFYTKLLCPGTQVVINYSIGQMARVPPAHRTSLQARLPIPSFQPWLLRESPI
jgi:hypothetical protein